MNLRNNPLIKFFMYFINPIISFFKELLDKSKGRRITVLWVIIIFLSLLTASKYAFVKISKNYAFGVDISNISSNDHILFNVYKNSVSYNDLKIGDFIMFYTDKMEPHIPRTRSIIKKVVAKQGDHIQVKGLDFYVNGEKLAVLRPQALEKLNKTQDQMQKDFIVSPNSVVVLGSYERSFDSRYWGELNFKSGEMINLAKPILF